jgi:hypothetical protein
MSLQHFRLTTLLLSVVCFAMPWIQLQCSMPDGSVAVVEQSGLQATYGGTSSYVNGRAVTVEGQQQPPPPAPAWLLTVHAAALVLALLFSQWMRQSRTRWLGVTLFSGVAAGALIAQIANGFPIVEGWQQRGGQWQFVTVEYTPWYWIAIAASIATPVVSLCERVKPPPPGMTGDEPIEEKPAWGD